VSIGAGDGPIEIVEHDRSWSASFLEESARLAPLLPGVRIHHIGSTAVPGLAAKPVIDMIAFVDDLDRHTSVLSQHGGYQVPTRFNVNLVHRRFLCYPSMSYRTHHLHLVDDREEMDRCLRFRDNLCADSGLAAEYVALKRGLAARFGDDREGYTKAKGEFILHAEDGRATGSSPAA
jgi:GrpB-like predicted nucleotidyltransferase (UPF0157 family)